MQKKFCPKCGKYWRTTGEIFYCPSCRKIMSIEDVKEAIERTIIWLDKQVVISRLSPREEHLRLETACNKVKRILNKEKKQLLKIT
jgi:uncharacterized Zn finger protein (UPF0148 family)